MCAGMCGYVCRHAGGRALEWGGHPSERGVPGVVLRCWCGACVWCIGPMRDRFRRQSCGDASPALLRLAQHVSCFCVRVEVRASVPLPLAGGLPQIR